MLRLRRACHVLLLAVFVTGGCSDDGAIARSRLHLRVVDSGTGQPLPARVLLLSDGTEPLPIGELDMYEIRQSRGFCELADGAIGTWNGVALAYGDAEIPIGESICGGFPEVPFGRYSLRAWRGIEYEPFETPILDLTEGVEETRIELPLQRVFDPVGTLAADLHVHAEDSNDSLVPRRIRVVTQAAAGIQVIGASEHNVNSDFTDAIRALRMEGVVASIPGNELSPDKAHLSVFPVLVEPELPRNGAPSYEELNAMAVDDLLRAASSGSDSAFVQLNHPRFRTTALYDHTGWDGVSWPPPFALAFNGVEVLAALTAFNEPMDERLNRSLRDFYAMISNGFFVTATGNSDTHHLNWVLDGTSRTYVYVNPSTIDGFSMEWFLDSLRARRAVATTAPWLDVSVDNAGPGEVVRASGPEVFVTVDVWQASFSRASHLRLLRGGDIWLAVDFDPEQHFHWEGTVPVESDTWIGVDVTGDVPLPSWLTGTYHQDKERSGVKPAALINPIVVQASAAALRGGDDPSCSAGRGSALQ